MFDDVGDGQAGAFLQWATARAVNTMVRCASMASRVRWNIGRACRSVLDIRNECSTCQRSWYLAITSAALGMHHGAGGWAIA